MSDEDYDNDIGDEYQPSDASEPEDNHDEDENEPPKKKTTNYHMKKAIINISQSLRAHLMHQVQS